MCNSKRLCDKEDCEICFNNSFASHEKSEFWSDKNIDDNGNKIIPRKVFKKSHKKYLFDCICGHTFDMSLSNITGINNNWCSYCSNKKLCGKKDCQSCFEKSFASHEKSDFWSDKNIDENGNKINPRNIFKATATPYWFKCDCGHEFENSPHHITSKKNTWCSYCSNPPKKICDHQECQSCFEKSFASHEKSKYWSDKNIDNNGNKIIPRQVFKWSHEKYVFNCLDCSHMFKLSLTEISRGYWCNYCSNKKLCENLDCQSCFEKSFASNEKSIFWSKKNVLTARQVFKVCGKKYLFNCKCNHEFETNICNITKSNTWCSYCVNQKLCDKEDCESCFEKSFASNEKSKYWSNKNVDENNININPRNIFKGTPKKYQFTCEKCNHEFQTSLNKITSDNSWCPYCSNKQLCDKEDCESCFEKSFASHEKSKFWSDKNVDENNINIDPRSVFKHSSKKYKFLGHCNHEFEIIIANITGINNNWCPICVNKTEKKLYEQLLQLYPNVISQFRIEWCKNPITNCFLPFDFVLEEQKVIIELDGPQHFVQISNWNTPEEQFENDKYKEKCANNNGYSVIRIIQEDVWNDSYDWLNELNQNIINIKIDNSIQNIYLCKNNEYNNFN